MARPTVHRADSGWGNLIAAVFTGLPRRRVLNGPQYRSPRLDRAIVLQPEAVAVTRRQSILEGRAVDQILLRFRSPLSVLLLCRVLANAHDMASDRVPVASVPLCRSPTQFDTVQSPSGVALKRIGS